MIEEILQLNQWTPIADTMYYESTYNGSKVIVFPSSTVSQARAEIFGSKNTEIFDSRIDSLIDSLNGSK